MVYSYFRPFVYFVCVNSGVYSCLLVFAPSLAFLCCFIFISAFVSSYSFIFLHVLAYLLYRSFAVQWVSAFWYALSAVLFRSFSLSLFALFAGRFVAVFSGRNNFQPTPHTLAPRCCIKLSFTFELVRWCCYSGEESASAVERRQGAVIFSKEGVDYINFCFPATDNLMRNTTQRAVINIFKKRILYEMLSLQNAAAYLKNVITALCVVFLIKGVD